MTLQNDHLSLKPVAQVHTRSHRITAELQSDLGCGLVFGDLGGKEGNACSVGGGMALIFQRALCFGMSRFTPVGCQLP